MLTLNSESPSVEKKVSSVIEKNQIDIVSTSDKKKVTPTKIIKTNEGGRRPGPKSRTCVPQLKTEKTTSSLLKKNEINPQQAGSNNVDLTDTDEAKSKKINIATKEEKMNEDAMTNSLINSVHTDNVIVKIEKKEIKLTTNLHQLDNGAKFDIVEENTIIRNHLEKEKNESIKTKVKEVTPEPKEDEDNIHNEELDHEMYEELDHEMYEELDHEFDEEEIIESSVGPNQTDTVKAVQEHNKDENNEDSINLTIGEEDIKLFADEEDTNIEKEDEVIGNQTDEKTSLIKQRESCHPVTSSRLSTGLVKSRRNATEKRSSIGDKLRSTHKEDKDISNAKPIINTLKDEKKEGEKQIKDKVETGNKQSNNSNAQQILNDTSKKNNSSLVRNIWVSGLSSITKATDLKQLFSKYGKVVGAKVVTNAKTPGARCYGFVTLSSAEDANRSIEHLHKTELHGRVISVERAKRDNGYQVTAKSSNSFKVNKNLENDQKTKIIEGKKDKPEEKREKRPEITINDVKKPDLSTIKHSSKEQHQDLKRSKIVSESNERRKDRSIKSKSNERDKERLRELEREREHLEREKRKQQEILNLTKLKTEREKQRQREHEREMREGERMRRIEKEYQLEIEKKQKEEAIHLEKERQKLKIERERIEKEKLELLRLERENQRLERERLQREKEELRRAQEKLEETKRQALLKRAAIPPSPPIPYKRHSLSNSSRYEERKEPIRSSRMQPSSDYLNQAPPPPPNITSSRHHYEQHPSDSRRMRLSPPPPPPPASRPKDSTVNIRYGAQLATDHHYRSRDDRSDRRDDSRRKDSSSGSSNRHAHASYDSSKSSYGISRNSESNTWPSVQSVHVKGTYGTLGASSGTHSMVVNMRPNPWGHSNFREMGPNVWQRTTQPPPEKWNSTSSNPSSMSISGRGSSSNTVYNNNQGIPNMGLNMSTNYSDSRFDSYKMSGMSRKY